ncbi:hypothetical protein Pen01_24490 [Phytomonospora endophytica]|nr:hypothetical protein Pen01_24490 [Phytomonospora endophytica]
MLGDDGGGQWPGGAGEIAAEVAEEALVGTDVGGHDAHRASGVGGQPAAATLAVTAVDLAEPLGPEAVERGGELILICERRYLH